MVLHLLLSQFPCHAVLSKEPPHLHLEPWYGEPHGGAADSSHVSHDRSSRHSHGCLLPSPAWFGLWPGLCALPRLVQRPCAPTRAISLTSSTTLLEASRRRGESFLGSKDLSQNPPRRNGEVPVCQVWKFEKRHHCLQEQTVDCGFTLHNASSETKDVRKKKTEAKAIVIFAPVSSYCRARRYNECVCTSLSLSVAVKK